jgi:DNA polymerase
MGLTKYIWYLNNKGVSIAETEAQRTHAAYRRRFHKMPDTWKGLDGAAKAAMQEPGALFRFNNIYYTYDGYWLVCTLPTGRPFYYPNARLQPGRYGDEIVYEGWMRIDGRPAGWGDVRTFGGLFLENITQATCRDILEEDQLVVEQQPGWEVILTVYDEIVASVPIEDANAVATMKSIMERPRAYMPMMPVMAEVFEADRYVKH